jgi:molybdopterin converting factor subunit 1
MRVTVKLFAIAKEKAGVGEVAIELSQGALAGSVCDRIVEMFPKLGPLMGRCAVAVNRAYVPRSTELREGDEVAIIPPVSGG